MTTLYTKSSGRKRCFEKRDYWVEKLGYKTYSNYLKSLLWKKIRQEVLLKRNYVCYFCGGNATQVHHLHYTKPTLLGKNNGGLVTTCSVCHKAISTFAKKNNIHEMHAYQLYNKYRRRSGEKNAKLDVKKLWSIKLMDRNVPRVN